MPVVEEKHLTCWVPVDAPGGRQRGWPRRWIPMRRLRAVVDVERPAGGGDIDAPSCSSQAVCARCDRGKRPSRLPTPMSLPSSLPHTSELPKDL